jgi:CheY-like chemotaxis protein
MFAIDLVLAEAATQGGDLPAGSARTAGLCGTFVIVVDDDEAALAAMRKLLEDWGCLALTAGGAAEALTKLAEHDRPPELLVCDYRLASGDTGIDAIDRIRDAVKSPVPAVLITGDTGGDVLSAARAVGVPVLHKPVSPVRLRAMLAHLLSNALDQRAEGRVEIPT